MISLYCFQDNARGQHERQRQKDSVFVLPGVPGKASHTEEEHGEDYQLEAEEGSGS